jgi:hypothetical protein
MQTLFDVSVHKVWHVKHRNFTSKITFPFEETTVVLVCPQNGHFGFGFPQHFSIPTPVKSGKLNHPFGAQNLPLSDCSPH